MTEILVDKATAPDITAIMLPCCPDCDAEPGQPHAPGCETERCSVCGSERRDCSCPGHDPLFARWTGFLPGEAEAAALGIDLDLLCTSGRCRILFIKPAEADDPDDDDTTATCRHCGTELSFMQDYQKPKTKTWWECPRCGHMLDSFGREIA